MKLAILPAALAYSPIRRGYGLADPETPRYARSRSGRGPRLAQAGPGWHSLAQFCTAGTVLHCLALCGTVWHCLAQPSAALHRLTPPYTA